MINKQKNSGKKKINKCQITFIDNNELHDYTCNHQKWLNNVADITILSSSKYIDIDEFENLESLSILKGKWKNFNKLINCNNKLINLNLINNNIITISKNINFLENLKSLILNDNLIEQIPLSLYSIATLETLSLDNNHICTISEEIINLTNLKYLSFKNNHIKTVPKSLWRHSMIEYIDLSMNKISKIVTCNKLQINIYLHTLKLSGNKLKKLPNLILPNLEHLELDNNELSDNILNVLDNYPLKTLSLSNNYIQKIILKTIPNNLRTLGLSGNKLVYIDYKIFEPQLKYLYLQNVQLLNDNLNYYKELCLSKNIKLVYHQNKNEIFANLNVNIID